MPNKTNEDLKQVQKAIDRLSAQVASLSAYVAATAAPLTEAEVGRTVRRAQEIAGLGKEGAPGVIAELLVKIMAKGHPASKA